MRFQLPASHSINRNLKWIAARQGRVRHMTGCNLKWINVRNAPNNSGSIFYNTEPERARIRSPALHCPIS